MKAISGLLLLLAAAFAVGDNQCPPEQISNWEIEKLLPHEYCDKFYKCTFGRPIELQCPSNLYFNIELSVCDWKSAVDCTGRKIHKKVDVGEKDESSENNNEGNATSEEPAQTTPEAETEVTDSSEDMEFLENGCPVDPTIHWLLPHETNCTLFYSCVWSNLVQMSCPIPTHFNRKEQVCDYPERAGCLDIPS